MSRIKAKFNGMSDEKREAIRKDLRARVLTIDEIATKYEIHKDTVRNIKRKAGIS